MPAPKRPCEKVVFTALDHTGNKLILAGWIIQFGEGTVSIAKPDRFDVPVPSCTIFAFTMHRDECENPDAVYELWGRSWRTASKQVAPGVAESFRIWARIADGEVERLLHISGLTSPPVYTETREDHQASSSTSTSPTKGPAFRILWLPKDTSAIAAVGQVAGHLGRIRGRTGRGIRIPDSMFMMSFLRASHQLHARSSPALGYPLLPKIRNVAKTSSSCTTRGPEPKEAKQCRPQSLRTLIGLSKTNPSRCRNSRVTLQPCSQKLRACRAPCRRSSNSSKFKISSPSNCKRTCKPRARASNRRSAHPSLNNPRPSWTRSGRCCEPRQSLDLSPHLSASLMRTRTCRIESSGRKGATCDQRKIQ